MLIYEAEGFLEVEVDSINRLCRSRDPVTFGDIGGSGFEVHAILCDFQDNSQSRCYVAFHDKALRTSLIFSVKSPGEASAWQHGQDALAGLEYQLDEQNLRLSPAMLEVVMKDVPGLLSPAEARKQRHEKAQFLAELQAAVETDPASAAGRKAALKLGAEKRLDERVGELRQLMIDTLSPAEKRDADGEAMMEQVRDLTARLEAAEGLVDQERKQREISELITAAAEKRIQELEEILVDVETRSAGEIKQKRRIVVLQRRIKELEGQLSLVSDDVVKERDKQEQFITDVRSAQEQIAALDDSLQKNQKMLADSFDQLAQERALRNQLETSFKAAEGRISELEEELRGGGEQNTRTDEADKVAEALPAQLEKLESEMRDLREDRLRECTLRKRLEKSAAEDVRRIRDLEAALEKAGEEASAATAEVVHDGEQKASLQNELEALERRLREEQAGKEDLEHDLEQAHKIIDSLEQMVKEAEGAPDPDGTEKQEENRKLLELTEEVALIKEQIAQERARQEELAEEVAAAEKKLADREVTTGKKPLNKSVATFAEPETVEAEESSKPAKARKPLPHELRPAPNKSAFFHPDWDLEGLPCKSEKHIVRAWETVFNVQISLEGYPSQYCMAFLIVLKQDNLKKMFMLFRLKQSKHTLVLVPAVPPANEAQLKKAIDEGLKFLKLSGFEMEEMPEEYISSSLGSYFLKE